MKKKDMLIAGGIILGSVMVFTYASKDFIAQRFPAFGNFLQSGFAMKSKNQDAELAMMQAKTLSDADDAISAAEKLSAETDEMKASTVTQAKDALPWKITAGDGDSAPRTKLNPRIKVFTTVKLDPHPDHLPAEGEQIVLPMLNGKTIKVNVESSESTENGDYSWSGHLDGHNNDYPIVMTYGENTTFATITTPEGSYSLEAVHGVGWLYKNPAEAELTAPGQNDYLIPNMH